MSSWNGWTTTIVVILLALTTGLALAPRSASAQRIVPDQVSLDQLPRVYGLSVAPSKSSRLYLATPLGLFLAHPDGKAEAVTGVQGNLMAYAVHPTDPRRMLAGGHEGQSGSIGVMLSTDGGGHWQQISHNAAGHVGFHILEVSKADPNTVYGVTNGLRVSSDGGRTWSTAGTLPRDLIHFAASALQVRTIYAATRQGLLLSRDQGATWQSANAPAGLTSMVYVSTEGRLYTFVVGTGLLSADERTLRWETLSTGFSDRIVLRMAQQPDQPQRLYAAMVTGAIVTSGDGGRSWSAFEGSHNANPPTVAKGKQLFNTYCQACHGPNAGGQQTAPDFNPNLPPPIMAPALDDSAHSWHHSDANLISTILEGSPREGSPMIAWKSQLSRADAEALVSYIKSLWSLRSMACQGARHMACMQMR